MSCDYDVVIVGGGLSGGSLAIALQNCGYRVAVVEAFTDGQRRASPAGDRALALAYGTVCHLRALHIWDQIAGQSAAIRDIHISDQGHFGKTRLSAAREGVEALGYVITAKILEDQIASLLQSASIDRICPASLIAFRLDSDRVNLDLRKGDSDLNLSARLLVGADGVNSAVRRFLNIELISRDYRQTAFVTSVRPEIDPAGTAYERFTSSGPLAMLPTVDGLCSVVWTQMADRAEKMARYDDPQFLAQLQKAFGFRLGRLSLQGPRVQFPLKLVRAKTTIGNRCVLVGNAAHQLHPVAGQGFNLGLRDIALLAEMIVDCANQDQDPGGQNLLQTFAAARSKDHQMAIRSTDSIVRIFSNDWWPLVMGRGLGLLGLDCCAFAKHQLSRYAMGLGGRLPRIGAGVKN